MGRDNGHADNGTRLVLHMEKMMTQLNASIRDIPIPKRLIGRPISKRGFPVPYFVTHKDDEGEWDFRAIEAETVINCHNKKLCWLCGQLLGQYKCFVIGPMCAFNRVSSEPPSHRDCAEYAVQACPFLAQPRARRNEIDMPYAKDSWIGGTGLPHNPGVTLLWITKSYKPFRADGVLFELGDPIDLMWFKERRKATRTEIDDAMSIGLPKVRAVAEAEGTEAVAEFEASLKRGMKLLPAE